MAWDEDIYTAEEVRDNAGKRHFSPAYRIQMETQLCKITYWCNVNSEMGRNSYDCYMSVYVDHKYDRKYLRKRLQELGYKTSVMWWMSPIKQDWIKIRW